MSRRQARADPPNAAAEPVDGVAAHCMVFHMKTTLVIEDDVMRRLKALAARRGVTLSALVEVFLRRGLREAAELARRRVEPWNPPAFHMGEPLVDIADREALERVMEQGDRDRR